MSVFKAVEARRTGIVVVANLTALAVDTLITRWAMILIAAVAVLFALFATDSVIAVLAFGAIVVIRASLAAEPVDADVTVWAIRVAITLEARDANAVDTFKSGRAVGVSVTWGPATVHVADHSRSAVYARIGTIRAAAAFNADPSWWTFSVWVVVRAEDRQDANPVDTFVSWRALLILTGRIAVWVASFVLEALPSWWAR